MSRLATDTEGLSKVDILKDLTPHPPLHPAKGGREGETGGEV